MAEPPRKTPQWILTAVLGFATLLLAALGIGSVRFAQRQSETAQWVSHTHEVIEQLQRIVSSVAEAESALRAYGISREPSFLDEISPAQSRAADAVSRVKEMVRDNREQRERLLEVEVAVTARLALITERKNAVMAGESAAIPPQAHELSRRIVDGVNRMLDGERQLLTDRAAHTEDATQLTIRSSVFATTIAVVLVMTTLLVLRREFRARQRIETHITLLLRLGELLQACRTLDEAFEVTQKFMPRFFEGSSGALALIHASRNVVETRGRWGALKLTSEAGTFTPDDCWALRRGQTYSVEAGRDDVLCKHSPADLDHPSLCVPLAAHGELIGVMQLVTDEVLDTRLRQNAESVGEQISMALGNLQLRETLRNQSIRDPLTGLFNRRYAEETLQREISGAERSGSPLAVVMIDVDHFKKVNDTYGHSGGDYVLKKIAELLRQKTRGHDVAARLGGEELVVILPGANLDAARAKAEVLRQAVGALELNHQQQSMGKVTISLGVSVFPTHGANAEELTRVADAALYEAKRGGRDRVMVPESVPAK